MRFVVSYFLFRYTRKLSPVFIIFFLLRIVRFPVWRKKLFSFFSFTDFWYRYRRVLNGAKNFKFRTFWALPSVLLMAQFPPFLFRWRFDWPTRLRASCESVKSLKFKSPDSYFFPRQKNQNQNRNGDALKKQQPAGKMKRTSGYWIFF